MMTLDAEIFGLSEIAGVDPESVESVEFIPSPEGMNFQLNCIRFQEVGPKMRYGIPLPTQKAIRYKTDPLPVPKNKGVQPDYNEILETHAIFPNIEENYTIMTTEEKQRLLKGAWKMSDPQKNKIQLGIAVVGDTFTWIKVNYDALMKLLAYADDVFTDMKVKPEEVAKLITLANELFGVEISEEEAKKLAKAIKKGDYVAIMELLS